jgi:hypothetical protein
MMTSAFSIDTLLIEEKSWTAKFCKHYGSFHFGFNVHLVSEEHVCRRTLISFYGVFVQFVLSK